jgi:uncharacterized SAM-binding protein YcdF (DUF218 family)
MAFAPANLVVLAILATYIALPRQRVPRAKRAIGALALLCVLIACTPLSRLPLVLLENRFAHPPLPDKVDGVVVLGGGIAPAISLRRDEPAVTVAAPRLLAFADLARRYPQARLVFTGGSGDIFHPDLKEAPVARQALQRMGLDVVRVLFDDRARNTRENALFAQALARPQPGETWLLVTSASHMPRAMGAFRAAGWSMTPWPVGYWTSGRLWSGWGFDFLGGLATLQAGVREWVGLAAYYARGYSASLFPGP